MVGCSQNFLRDHDKMGDHWSSGTIYHPSSQSRKISIGLMADSSGKKRPGATNADDEVPIPNEERVKHVMENAKEVKYRVEGITTDTIGVQTETPAQASSPWITKRSSYRKEYPPETPVCEKQGFSIPSSSGRQNKQQGCEKVTATHSVHFFANRTSVFQSVQSNQKICDRDTQKNKEGRDGIPDKVEEFASTTAKEVFLSGKAVAETITDKTENRCSSTLKMKLWEILGNASSAKDQDPQSHSLKVYGNNSMPAENLGRMGETVGKHGQNSDTIETDSENPNDIIGRPVTRSLSRKRAPKKLNLNKVKDKAPSICEQKQQEKNVFSFVEGLSSRLNNDNNSGSSRSTRKWNERPSSRTELRKIYYPEKDNAGKIQQKTNAIEVAAPVEKSSSLGMIGRFRTCPLESDKYQQKSDIQEKSPHQSSMENRTDRGDVNSPYLSGNKDQQECFAYTSTNNAMDPEVYFQSPTFRLNTPTPDSSPSPVPKSNEVDQGVHSPAPEDREFSAVRSPAPKAREFSAVRSSAPEAREFSAVRSPAPEAREFSAVRSLAPEASEFSAVHSPAPKAREFSAGDIPSFRTFGTSKQNRYGSNVQKKSPEDVPETKTSPGKKSASDLEENNADDGVAESSSSEDENSESSEEGCGERMTFSPDVGTAVSPKITLKSIKRHWNYEDIRFKELSSFPPSPKGTVESDWIHEPPEQTQEDELARAVTLFAMALKGLKSKIKFAAGKKSSEVLLSVAEIIRLQLENIDAQIQTDIEKQASISKSKRRRLETKFQEQQEQLNLIHDKFKEEVNQHLLECRETLSLLEAHQIEFKGTTEKQRASHRKLVMQVDEAIKMQLNDAQKRIMAINKLARGQMLQLKYAMSECLKAGVLS